MSATGRWEEALLACLFALTGFFPFTVSADVWTAMLLGSVIGVVCLGAARRTASWPDALIALAGLWIIVSFFVGGLQAAAVTC